MECLHMLHEGQVLLGFRVPKELRRIAKVYAALHETTVEKLLNDFLWAKVQEDRLNESFAPAGVLERA